MQDLGAANEADGCHAVAVSFQGVLPGGDDSGMVGQAEVVVTGQVDDLAAVVVANRGLLVVEDAELEVGAFGAEFVESRGQVGELGARSGLIHGDSPKGRSITPKKHNTVRRTGLSIPVVRRPTLGGVHGRKIRQTGGG